MLIAKKLRGSRIDQSIENLFSILPFRAGSFTRKKPNQSESSLTRQKRVEIYEERMVTCVFS